MFNTSKAPFDNVNARKAVAWATDRDQYIETVGEGVPAPADGVFTKNSPWYVDSNFPTLDLANAKEFADKYQQETGQPLTFTLGVGGPDSKPNGELLQAQWKKAGINAEVKVAEQGSFIAEAVTGAYEANLWRQFGAPDPDADFLWWTSANAGTAPEGDALTLNIARNKSECVDEAILAGREEPEEAARKQAYADLQQCFADEQPYIWLTHTNWIIVAAPYVRGITNGPLPDGEESLPVGGAGDFGGVTRLTQTWLAP